MTTKRLRFFTLDFVGDRFIPRVRRWPNLKQPLPASPDRQTDHHAYRQDTHQLFRFTGAATQLGKDYHSVAALPRSYACFKNQQATILNCLMKLERALIVILTSVTNFEPPEKTDRFRLTFCVLCFFWRTTLTPICRSRSSDK